MEFGKLMRQFRDTTCEDFDTVELPREVAARNRRQAGAGMDTEVTSTKSPTAISARKKRRLNLGTVKFHFLGDYTRHIHRYGTTDSYSTQMVRPHCACLTTPSDILTVW